MNTLQNLRSKAQEMLSLANVDQAFGQLLQVNPELALSAAGVPNAHLYQSPDAVISCSWTCAWTCSWTS